MPKRIQDCNSNGHSVITYKQQIICTYVGCKSSLLPTNWTLDLVSDNKERKLLKEGMIRSIMIVDKLQLDSLGKTIDAALDKRIKSCYDSKHTFIVLNNYVVCTHIFCKNYILYRQANNCDINQAHKYAQTNKMAQTILFKICILLKDLVAKLEKNDIPKLAQLRDNIMTKVRHLERTILPFSDDDSDD